MKANRNSLWQQDDRAEVGIGTMIVFIATILVAATAAAVLIDTSGKLSQRSSVTGNEATRQVASNLIVKAVTGERDSTSVDLQYLNITIAHAPGASEIDVEQIKIQVTNGATIYQYQYAAAESTTLPRFQYEFERDSDASTPAMNTGDMVDVKIDLKSLSFTLAERKDVQITMMPEVGPAVDASFTTPESYGSDKFIVLR